MNDQATTDGHDQGVLQPTVGGNGSGLGAAELLDYLSQAARNGHKNLLDGIDLAGLEELFAPEAADQGA